MLILTINASTDADCKEVKADSKGDLDRSSCYGLTLNSGNVCCRLKQTKVDSETRSCVVLEKDDEDIAEKYGEELIKKDTSLINVEISCNKNDDYEVESKEVGDYEDDCKKGREKITGFMCCRN